MAKKMREALTLAAALSKKEAGSQVCYYDKKARATVLDPGDQVLMRLSWAVGNQKLADHWLDELHEVVEKFRDTPVYKVRNLSTGKTFTVHHNHLLLTKAHILQCEELKGVPVTNVCPDPDTLLGGGVEESLKEHSDNEDWVLALEYPLNSEAEKADQEHTEGSEAEAAETTSLKETNGSG